MYLQEEMTREAEARSWDETIDNVWHRMTICDHLLELRTWRHDDPKPLRGMSFATATRHLRILRKRLEKLMGKAARGATIHDQIYRKNNGNYCSKARQQGRNTMHSCGKRTQDSNPVTHIHQAHTHTHTHTHVSHRNALSANVASPPAASRLA